MPSSRDLHGCTIYVALFPCNECAKAIIQAGIREVVYLSDKYAHTDVVKASKLMMTQAGVIFRQLRLKDRSITIDFTVES
jgi:dCMP deaminase